MTRWLAMDVVKLGGCVLLAVVCTLFSRYAIPFAFSYSMSLLPLVVAVVLFLVFRCRLLRTWDVLRGSVRYAIVAIVVSVLFACFLIAGAWSSCDDAPSFTAWNIVAIPFVALPLLVAFVMLMDGLDWCASRLADRAAARACAERPVKMSLRWAGGAYAVLLLCWLPVFLAAFPGFFCYDMSVSDFPEYTQWTVGTLVDHQPVLHTLLVGAVLSAGEALTGSVNAGIAVFVVLQALAVAGVFTFMVSQIWRMTASRALCVASVAYLALDPLVSLFVNCTAKDTLFSALVVLLAVLLFARISSKEPSGVRTWVAIGLAALGVCLLRPNGVLAFVVVIPFAIFCAANRRERVRAAVTSAIVLALSFAWFVPIATALDVVPSPYQRLNALSIPAQQMSAVVTEHSGDGSLRLSDMQMLMDAQFGQMEDGERVSKYDPVCADASRHNLADMSLPDVLRVWASLGLAYPEEYAKALIWQTEGAWNPYACINVYDTPTYQDRETSLFAFDWESPAEHQSLFPALVEPLREFSTGTSVQNVPVVSLLTSIPFYVWTLIVLVARAIVTRDRRLAAPCALFAMLALTALLGPCVLVRYYLYLVFGLPLVVTMLMVPDTCAAAQR